jgi:hypothetical protein
MDPIAKDEFGAIVEQILMGGGGRPREAQGLTGPSGS